MQRKLSLFIKTIIVLTFFIPLIVLPNSYIFPFIVPKIIWFRSLSLLMLGGYLLLLASNWQEYRPRLTAVNIFVGLFFLSFTISTFIGVDWYRSFWDNHERMLGLFTIFHYLVYYLVITSVVKEWRDWRWLLRIFLLAGTIIMIIGAMQKVNPELLINRGSSRVSATLGNAIYFSGYGLFLFFVGLLLALKERGEILRLRSGQAFWFWYAVAGSLFGFLGVFWGGTRGTVLGLLAGGVLMLLVYLFVAKEHKKLKLIAWGLIGLGVVLLALLFNFRQTSFVKSIPAVGGLLNLNIYEGTASTRLMAWEIAVKAWEERPIFGWGPNNYYYAFNKYYNPKFLEHGWGETWFDNAHSSLFNTLTTQGLVGFLTYILLFGAGAWALIVVYRKKQIDKHVLAVGLAFLAGHFVHNSTVFENPTSYLYFFFFLAFINQTTDYRLTLGLSSGRRQTTDNKNRNISIVLTILIGLVILLMIYSTNINTARANHKTLLALKSFYDNGNPVMLFQEASAIPSPHIDDIRNDFARTVIQVSDPLVEQKQIELVKKLTTLAEEEMKKNFILHPLDIRTHITLAQIYIQRAQTEGDIQYIFSAEKILEEALILSPKRQQVQFMLAGMKLELQKGEEAVALLQSAVENGPNIKESWRRLAGAYEFLGQNEKMQETIVQAQERGINLLEE